MKKIGKKLKKTREDKKISLDQVYKKTKIRPNVIVALEEGRLEDLPDPIYVKSFLKEYAIYLGLDPKPLLEKYSSILSEQSLGFLSVETLSNKTDYIKRLAFFKKIIYIVIVLAVMFFVIWGIGKIGKGTDGKKKSKELKTPVVVPSNKSVTEEQQLVAENKSLKLKIESVKDTWIQVQSDGNIIFQKVLNKGTIQEFKANEKFRLWVGKASGVKLYLNNIPLNSIGKGVIKNILIDRSGMHIPDK